MTPEPASAPVALPRWQEVANRLEGIAAGPSPAQQSLAEQLSIELPATAPSQVAAVLLHWELRDALGDSFRTVDSVTSVLNDIEDELGVERTAELATGTQEELSAWFDARYALKTARGLRDLRPEAGDVVTSPGWRDGEQRIVSSIGDNGRIYMRLHPPRSAWPNNLEVVERVGSPTYTATANQIRNRHLDSSVSTSTNLANFSQLERYRVHEPIPHPEAVRALEDLLDSGERREEAFQRLLTHHPQLLSSLVVGGWRTYVIPKPRLGAEYVPDFLVLGINSVGPQWVTVEIEGPRHQVLTRAGGLSQPTRHALDQVFDWREWLTANAHYVQAQAGYHGLTSQAAGLVIIGRDDPSAERQPARARSEEDARIPVHSWDWLLRNAKNLAANRFHTSAFAVNSLNEQAGRTVASVPRSVDDTIVLDPDDEEFEELNADNELR